ncbi:MAG: hypothetical protein F9B45_02130 [Phycisphaera sp. RhM]|nr:hypothetical protein [Phycisphaera sp. RhM]
MNRKRRTADPQRRRQILLEMLENRLVLSAVPLDLPLNDDEASGSHPGLSCSADVGRREALSGFAGPSGPDQIQLPSRPASGELYVDDLGNRELRFKVSIAERLPTQPPPPADLFYSAATSLMPVDWTLRVADANGADVIELIESATQQLLAWRTVASIGDPLLITGSPFDDVLQLEIDASYLETHLPNRIVFQGIVGSDLLRGPVADTTWSVTGGNTGNVGGQFEFLGVETLLGAANNEDTFVFAQDAFVSGSVRGGDGGFDSVVIDGDYNSVAYTASGPDSGTINLDGRAIEYVGMEPITQTGTASEIVWTSTTTGDDQILLKKGSSSGEFTIESENGMFERHSFNLPPLVSTTKVTINAGVGNDKITIGSFDPSPHQNSLGAFELHLSGGAGNDVVVVPEIRGAQFDLSNASLKITSVSLADASTLVNGEALVYFSDAPERAVLVGTGAVHTTFTGEVLFTLGPDRWIDQGPHAVTNSTASNVAPNNPVAGAVQSIAVHPTDPSIVFVGTVNGGVWRTTNASYSTPTTTQWEPLTQQFASLSIGSVAIDPLNANMVYAGTGQFSNGFTGGDPIGILKSNDAGKNWELLGTVGLAGQRIKELVPTAIGSGSTQVILAATISGKGWDSDGGNDPRNPRARGGGLFRSIDGGQTFVLVNGGLPFGAVTQLIVDPTDSARFYAAVPGKGVYRSVQGSGGSQWVAINNGLAGIPLSSQIEISAPLIGNVLFAGISSNGEITGATMASPLVITSAGHGLSNGDVIIISGVEGNTNANGTFQVAGVTTNTFQLETLTGTAVIGNKAHVRGGTWTHTRFFRSADNGSQWTALAQIGLNAGATFHDRFNMVADRANDNIVYVSGQGRDNIFRYSPTGAGSWVQIVGSKNSAGLTKGNTSPHPDSRDLVFLNSTTLLEADDGGIYFLANPADAVNNAWQSLTGDLGAFESYSVAYDSVNKVFLSGFQDNGSAVQTVSGNLNWQAVPGANATLSLGGDGQTQQVDSTSADSKTSTGQPGALRYSLANNLKWFYRNHVDGNGNPINTTRGSITDATNATPVVVTSTAHGLANDDAVIITGVHGNNASNGSFQVDNVTADTFKIKTLTGDVEGNGAYTGGGVWHKQNFASQISGAAGDPVTIRSNNHGLRTGDQITIHGLQGGLNALNGNHFIVSRIDNDQFKLIGTRFVGNTQTTALWVRSNRVLMKRRGGDIDLTGLNPADRNETGFVEFPFVLNAVDPQRMLLGRNGLYEDADTSSANGMAGDVIIDITKKLATPFGGENDKVSALVYGGYEGAIGKANVAYVGTTGGQLYYRSPSLDGLAKITEKKFTKITDGKTGHLLAGGTIRDIVVDPQDWRRVYVLRDNEVWMSNNVTALSVAANQFQKITDNLVGAPGALTSKLQSITMYDTTPTTAGDSIVIVGGLGGIFRRLPSSTAGKFVWTEFGSQLPNVLVNDVRFANVDPDGESANGTGIFYVATMGAGIRTIENVSANIAQPHVLALNGSAAQDTFRIVRSAGNPTLLDVFFDESGTTPVHRVQIAQYQRIQIQGLGGNDKIIVDSSNGLITVPDGIVVNGGTGTNELVVKGKGTPEPSTGSVVKLIDTTVGVAGRQSISYSNATLSNLIGTPTTASEILKSSADGLKFFGATVRTVMASGSKDPAVTGGTTNSALLGGASPTFLADAISGKKDASVGRAGTLEAAPFGTVESLLGDTSFLLRLIEEGTNGFNLGDLGDSITTLDDFKNKLDALDSSPGNVSYTQSAGVTTFDVRIINTLDGFVPIDVNLDFAGGKIRLDGSQQISAELNLHFVFGIDSQGVFFDVGNTHPELVVSKIQTTGEVRGAGRFGFLEVKLDNASLNIDPTVAFSVNLKEPSGSTIDNKIRTSELTADTIGIVDLAFTGNPAVNDVVLAGTFSVGAILPGLDAPFELGSANVNVSWADVNDITSFSVAATGGPGQQLLDFLKVNTDEVLDQLKMVKDHLTAFQVDVPFLGDSLNTLTDVVNAFDQSIVQPLSEPVTGKANFPTVQQLATTVATALGLEPDTIDLKYDGATKELTYRIDVPIELFDESKDIDFGFDLAKGLADLSFSTQANVDANVNLGMRFGIDLDGVIAGDDPSDYIFIRDAKVSGNLSLVASAINASARFGFISVDVVNGSGSANMQLDVSLVDPKTNADDGRIDVRELIAAVTNDPKSLVDPNFSGSAQFSFPLTIPILGITTASADSTLTVSMPDFTDPSTVQVQLPNTPDMSELLNFTRIDAASLVSQFGQLANFLDGLRKSSAFANFDIPFTDSNVGDILKFAEMFSDALLFDEGDDDKVDGNTKLVFDLNKALSNAGLGSRIRAEGDGSKITLIADDPQITAFSIKKDASDAGGYTKLNFTDPQTAVSDNGFLKVTSTAFSSDPNAVKLAGDAVVEFSITTAAGTTPFDVTIKKTDTDNNTGVGDDRERLLDAGNKATFKTHKDLARKLAGLLGLTPAVINARYDAPNDSLLYEIDFSNIAMGILDVPLDFDLNLQPLLNLDSKSNVRLSGNAGFKFTLGLYLGDADPNQLLSVSDTIESVYGTGVIKTDLAITSPFEVIERFQFAEAKFNVTTTEQGQSQTPVLVTVPAANITARDVIGGSTGVVQKLNDALATAGLGGKIEAGNLGNLLLFRAKTNSPVTTFSIDVVQASPALEKELGFATNGTATKIGDEVSLRATKSLRPTLPPLSADANFAVEVAGNTHNIVVKAPDTQGNGNLLDLVFDLNQAFKKQSIDTLVKAESFGRKLIITALNGATPLRITSTAGDPAIDELGLATALLGNTNDLSVFTRDGSSFAVSLDGATTLDNVINAINTAGAGKVTAGLNAAKTALQLTDNTSGNSTFRVQPVNNSAAAARLGIMATAAADVSASGQSTGSSNVIEGQQAGGVKLLDRLFLQNAVLSGNVALSTPDPNDVDGDTKLDDGIQASARFGGFVGIALDGGGSLSGSLSAGFKNPTTGQLGGRVTLSELITGIQTDVTSVIALPSISGPNPTATGTAQLDLALKVTPDLPFVQINNPKLNIQVPNIFADLSASGAIIVNMTDLGELIKFDTPDLTFDSILDALSQLVDFLGAFEKFGFLDEDLPVLDVSLHDLISLTKKFKAVVDQARANPAATLQFLEDKIEEALGVASAADPLTLALYTDNKGTPSDTTDDLDLLRITVDLGADFDKNLGINFDLGGAGILTGSAGLRATGDLDFTLDFGIDLTSPSNVYVFDSSGLTGTLAAAATDLDFKAGIKPISVAVRKGQATVGPTPGGPVPNGKLFHAGLDFDNDPAVATPKLLSEVFSTSTNNLGTYFTASIGGTLDVDLPVYVPESKFKGTIQYDATLAASLSNGIDVTDTLTAVDPNNNPIPIANLFNIDLDNFSPLDNLLLAIDGVDAFLELVQTLMDGQIGSFTIPLIGDSLEDGAQFVEDFGKRLLPVCEKRSKHRPIRTRISSYSSWSDCSALADWIFFANYPPTHCSPTIQMIPTIISSD